MARQKPQPIHPSSSSSSSDDDDGSASPPPPSQTPKKNSSTTPRPPPPPPPQDLSSSDEDQHSETETGEDESESGSESQSPPPQKKAAAVISHPPQKKAATVSSPPPRLQPQDKPKAPPLTKSDGSDPEHPPPRLPRGPDPIKLVATEPEEDDSKKPKKDSTKKRKAPDTPPRSQKDEPNGPSSKKLFERVWIKDDEIVLLKGLMEYQIRYGREPTSAADAVVLLDMARKEFHGEFTTSQLVSKIRNMKKKYTGNSAKEKEGAERVFSNAHEKEMYDLSKKVWGGVQSEGRERKTVTVVEEDSKKGEDGMKSEDSKKSGGHGRAKSGSITVSPGKRKSSAVANDAQRDAAVVESRGDEVEVLNPVMNLIVEEVGKHSISFEKIDTLKRALGIMKPEVVAAFGESWKELDLDEFRLWTRRVQLTIDILKAAEEVLDNARN